MDNTIELWQKCLEQQESSGLNIREWCRQNHIAEKIYDKWKKVVLASDAQDRDLVEFVPLDLPYDSNLHKKNCKCFKITCALYFQLMGFM